MQKWYQWSKRCKYFYILRFFTVFSYTATISYLLLLETLCLQGRTWTTSEGNTHKHLINFSKMCEAIGSNSALNFVYITAVAPLGVDMVTWINQWFYCTFNNILLSLEETPEFLFTTDTFNMITLMRSSLEAKFETKWFSPLLELVTDT